MRYITRSVFGAALILGCAAFVFGQKELAIAAVQGSKQISPYEGQAVRVAGVVTARTRRGFYLQTPDDQTDKDASTSDGIYIFTRTMPDSRAVPGTSVKVSGTVEEYRPRGGERNLPITEVSHRAGTDTLEVIGKAEIPKPSVLTPPDFKANTVDQLERFEGMRVSIPEMLVVAPTGGRIDHKNETVASDGVFFAVVKGIKRPFREAGVQPDPWEPEKSRETWLKAASRITFFDSNPEVIRIDTSEQTVTAAFSLGPEADKMKLRGESTLLGKPLNVAAKTEIRNVTGVLDYQNGKYTIFTDFATPPVPSSAIKPAALPAATERQFVVAAANIETFNDDIDDPDIKDEDIATPEAFEKRLVKVSLAIRDYLRYPDVLAVIEAENINVLKKLATRVNADAVSAGKPDPKYEAFLFEGNDGRGIDCGFLIKTARVNVISAKQFGKDDKFRNPVTKNDQTLNDRPPIVIELGVPDTKSGKSLAFTVVANHLKSYSGINDEKNGPAVREKKRRQSEFLARWVNERQKANKNERILLVGDFNAYQFSDGLVDVIGTIKGTPAAKDTVELASDDLVETDLANFVDLIAESERYSFTFDGNAQALDHFLANEAMRRHLMGFGFLRVNADFPAAYRGDGTRVERFSDHDVALGYFSLDPKP